VGGGIDEEVVGGEDERCKEGRGSHKETKWRRWSVDGKWEAMDERV
jgi:hypothetical protein